METAEELMQSLLYMGGVKCSKVSIVEVHNKHTSLLCNKIENISNYHSIQFEDKVMRLWNYYEIGEGKPIPYGETDFKSGLNILCEFKSANQISTDQTPNAKNPRLDRSRNEILICTEPHCIKTFLGEKELEDHLTAGEHCNRLKGENSDCANN